MNHRLAAAALAAVSIVVASSSIAFAQPAEPAADWSAWEPLVGNWVADASPDGAVGGFSFAAEPRHPLRRHAVRRPQEVHLRQ